MPQYFDSTAGFPMKSKVRKYASGGRVGFKEVATGFKKLTPSIKARGTKGKCTPITKPGCTGRAKALAKTFKKMA